MKKSPTVTVIIPTYNRAHFLAQAIDSCLTQTRPPDDIVVVDDGSTDNTFGVIAAYGDLVRRLRQPNSGKSAALNAALATIRTDYVMIADDDDIVMSDALERHLDFLGDNPAIDFTYSGCYFFSGREPPAVPDPKLLYDAAETTASEFFIRCLETFPFQMGGMLVPMSCYLKVGPFDQQLTFGQDYEMILRIARVARGGKLKNPTFLVRQHDGPRGPARERRTASEREARWREYERLTFYRLRGELTLDEYLPKGFASSDTDLRSRRQALLQRACVMARHGVFAEALCDLRSAVESPHMNAPFSAKERSICSRMLDLEPDLLQGQDPWLEQVSRLLRKRRSISLVDACVAGLGWSLQREWKRKSWSGAAVVTQSILRLAGRRLLPLMTRRTWSLLFGRPRLVHE